MTPGIRTDSGDVAPQPDDAPGAAFNIAAHLLQRNHAHPARPAFVDDHGSLSYGALGEQVRRLAAGLRAAGVRREERVLLLMHDNCHWPVAFLGAMYAGIVPVAVNTLLTADDYAYMLTHSRAQAVLVSEALRPVLRQALQRASHEVHTVLVSRATSPLAEGEHALESWLGGHAPMDAPGATGADDPGFWLYSSGSAMP